MGQCLLAQVNPWDPLETSEDMRVMQLYHARHLCGIAANVRHQHMSRFLVQAMEVATPPLTNTNEKAEAQRILLRLRPEHQHIPETSGLREIRRPARDAETYVDRGEPAGALHANGYPRSNRQRELFGCTDAQNFQAYQRKGQMVSSVNFPVPGLLNGTPVYKSSCAFTTPWGERSPPVGPSIDAQRTLGDPGMPAWHDLNEFRTEARHRPGIWAYSRERSNFDLG